MYKTDYLTYHIGKCESFQELVDVLRDQTIISYSRPISKEYSFEKLCRSIQGAAMSEQITFCTRAHGFRAKVAELLMSHNYGDPIPEELGFHRVVKLGGSWWEINGEK